MKCDNCKVKECETREVLKRHKELELSQIIERNCMEYTPGRKLKYAEFDF